MRNLTVVVFASAILLTFSFSLAALPDSSVSGQTRTEDDRIGDLETRVAELETAVAGGIESPNPTATATIAAVATQDTEASTVIGNTELLYYYIQQSEFGGSEILGEFLNISAEIVSTPTLSFVFRDATGNILDTAETSPVLYLMQPGEAVPFTAVVDLEMGQWEAEEFTSSGGGPAGWFDLAFYAEGLSIQNVNEVEAAGTNLRVLGEVRNDGQSPASLVQVQALLYGQDGRFFESVSGFVDIDEIGPGQSAPFEIDSSYISSSGPWTYRLVVSGWPV